MGVQGCRDPWSDAPCFHQSLTLVETSIRPLAACFLTNSRDTQRQKMLLSLLLTVGLALTTISAAPQRGNNQEASGNPRFFTGNNNLASAIAGAAIGAGASFLGNQILNPCRGGGNRNSGNSGSDTNNRFLGNNGATNGLLGIIGGFIAGQVANNVQGNPCG